MADTEEKQIRRALDGWTDFEKDVLVATSKIPKGKVSTYGRIAKMIGRPRAYRAVANTLHKNPLHPEPVPCHRVVKADGGFGGDKEGASKRRRLVAEEGVPLENGRVKMTDDILF
ncbi:MGMT family protein [Candidatus Thorarchaeota archaeon]|nr:MAG: MGMT family protein [Candidatus Thorarchaeota archaeon]